MKVSLYLSYKCEVCRRTESNLRNLISDYPNLRLVVIDVDISMDRKISIIPAIFINDELICYGEQDSDKLKKKLLKK